MTELEFITAKFGSSYIHSSNMNNFSRVELAELIEEFNEIQGHIKKGHVTLDNSPISAKEWIDYNERFKDWQEKYEGRMDTMDAGMSRPNKPNYFRANND